MPAYTTKTETVGNITYLGQAAIGSLTSSPVWRIRRIVDNSGNLDIGFADGRSDWKSVWDDRASYSYS